MSNTVNPNIKIVQVNTPGPQGPQGPQGDAASISASNNITASGDISGSGGSILGFTDVTVTGTISASVVSASTGVFGANTVIIGDTTISQPTGQGITFRDSGSNELGAFQGNGYFILSSSVETGGITRPLFSLAQQVGTVQNNNVMQVDLTSMKFLLGNAGQHGQWKLGGIPSGSDRQGDFYLNDNFISAPAPDTVLDKPAFYVTASNKYWGIGTFPNSTNMVRISGSLFTDSFNGDITASRHISASGTIFADKFVSAGGDDQIEFNDNLNVTGNITASGNLSGSSGGDLTGFNTGSFNHLSASGNLEVKHISGSGDISLESGGQITASSISINETGSFGAIVTNTISSSHLSINSTNGLVQVSASIYTSGSNVYNLGTSTNKWNNIFATSIGDGSPVENLFVDDLTFTGNEIRQKNNTGNIILAPIGSTRVGIATTNPSARLHVNGHISSSGLEVASSASFSGDIITSGDISASGKFSSHTFGGNSAFTSITSSGNLQVVGTGLASGTGSINRVEALTIRALGDISASGDLHTGNNIIGDGTTNVSGIQHITASGDVDATTGSFNHISASLPSAHTNNSGVVGFNSGDLFTLSGSQIFSSSAFEQGFVEGFVSESKFVFMK